jgi:hypothetical protein
MSTPGQDSVQVSASVHTPAVQRSAHSSSTWPAVQGPVSRPERQRRSGSSPGDPCSGPISGTCARTVWTVRLKRRVWATMARIPLADSMLAMCRASARLVASGFSTSRGLPARHAASTMAGWSVGGTAILYDVAGVARPVLAQADQPDAEHWPR